MSIGSFPNRLLHSPFFRFTIMILFGLIWGCLAFCGEIHEAVKSNDLPKVRKLLKQNPELVSSKDNQDFTPLHLAALNGRRDIVTMLLANKANVNAKDNWGTTPLHWAAARGHTEVAELLLANKAEVNAKEDTEAGFTPLHWAAMNGHRHVVALLLANKADVNANDKRSGLTPLHLAARNAHKDVVELLLANKANVDADDIYDETPLRMAARNGHKEIAELLLANKANINAVIGFFGYYGQTSIDGSYKIQGTIPDPDHPNAFINRLRVDRPNSRIIAKLNVIKNKLEPSGTGGMAGGPKDLAEAAEYLYGHMAMIDPPTICIEYDGIFYFSGGILAKMPEEYDSGFAIKNGEKTIYS
jgi:hypothetical protein